MKRDGYHHPRAALPARPLHANPWKAFPFDDPYGEWPPSPWRLIRALIARSHQFAREEPSFSATDRVELVRAFCTSSIRSASTGAIVAARPRHTAISTGGVQSCAEVGQRAGLHGACDDQESRQLLGNCRHRRCGLVVYRRRALERLCRASARCLSRAHGLLRPR